MADRTIAAEPGEPEARDPLAPAEGMRATRPGRPLVIAAALVAALAVIGAAVALLWVPEDSPAYSLREMRTAASAGDWTSLEAYFDVESVASTYINAALASAFADEDSATTGSSRDMGGSVGVGSEMSTGFVERFSWALQEAIEQKTLSAEDGGVATILLGDESAEVELVSEIEARATMQVPTASGAAEEVVLVMKRVDDHWRVIALEGITDLTGPLN